MGTQKKKSNSKSKAPAGAQEPATAADAAAAAKLARTNKQHIKPPSLVQLGVYASEDAQSVLVGHASDLQKLGVDAKAIAANAIAASNAAALTLRLIESANRAFESYEVLRATGRQGETTLTKALRGLPPSSSLRAPFAQVLSNVSAAAGTSKRTRTARAKKKAPKPAS